MNTVTTPRLSVLELLQVEEVDAWLEYLESTRGQGRAALPRGRAVGVGSPAAAAPRDQRTTREARIAGLMPRLPFRRVGHDEGCEDGDFHETIDGFDSHALSRGDASASLYERTVTADERKRWKAEDEERERRRRPAGFAAWSDR